MTQPTTTRPDARATLLSIGGSDLQLPGLRWAREAGLEVVLTDARPDAPGRALCERFHCARGDDVPTLTAIAAELAAESRFAGAYCNNDFGLEAVAAIGAATGTPAASPAAVALALDKHAACARLVEADVRVPRGRLVAGERDLRDAIGELGLPVIVKPTGSSGSRGVRSVRAEDELVPALEEASRFAETVRVERLVHGHHVDVNGFFANRCFVRGGLLDRFFAEPPFHHPIWGCQPSFLEAERGDEIYEVVERAARALGIDAGPVKADVVMDEHGPVVLEVTPRFHGDVSTAHVTPLACRRSPIQDWMRYLADPEAFELPEHRTPERFGGWIALFPERAGVLRSVRGLEHARKSGRIDGALMHKRPGQRVAVPGDNTAVVGFLWATGRDREDLEARLHAARAGIELIVA